MSLQSLQRASCAPFADCSRSNFSQSTKWLAKMENEVEDLHDGDVDSNLAADLRSIGHKYDKLVLKMFNDRSHLRGDIKLLKKDAQLLRNEMKCLIAKHDKTTAFKKGFSPEDHEKERVLKAELVTKEMGQLELALADLMSKYYYLLQQTKTLQEINSLWHIRSVLKSDFLQMNFEESKSHDSMGAPTMKNSIVKKDSKEIRDESARLIEKVRWLTKLGYEFRKELQELGSAKMALLTGRSCLETEYCKVINVEPIQDSIPRTLDVNSIAMDIRNAELRIIDSLHERTKALDKLTDEFKDLMMKAGFGVSDNIVLGQTDLKIVENDTPELSTTQIHERYCREEESAASMRKENACDSNEDSENEPEEIQVRFIRTDAIEDTDLRCLQQPELTKYSRREAHKISLFQYRRSLYSKKQGQVNVRRRESEKQNAESCDYGAIDSKDLNSSEAQQSKFDEEFVDRKDNFTSTVMVWLHPEDATVARNDSEETLTADVDSNGEDEETRFCKLIEKQFEDVEDDRRKCNRQKRKIDHCIEGYGSKRESNKSINKKSVDRFTKELTSLLSITSKPNTGEIISSFSHDATDCDNRHERFNTAKNFFELEPVSKEKEAKTRAESRNEAEGPSTKDMSISDKENHENEITNKSKVINHEIEVTNKSKVTNHEQVINHEQIEHEEKAEIDANKKESLTRESSTSSMQKTMTHENRPVFYDPVGTWKASGSNDTRFQRSKSNLSGSTTLERNKKSKVNSTASKGTEKEADIPRPGGSYAYKTLPRGFKSRKVLEKENNPLKVTGNVTPRRPPGDSGVQPCNTLPRKMKIRSSVSKQTSPDNSIQRESPDVIKNIRETSQASIERQGNNKAPSQIKPISRSNSQLTSKRLSIEEKSSYTNRDNFTRNGSRTTRPLSRIGSSRQETNADKTDVLSRRPVSRGSMYRPESRSDKTRPTSRNGSLRQNNASIYGTLPRTRKRVTGEKEGSVCESEAASLNPPSGETSKTSSFDRLSQKTEISIEGDESQKLSDTVTFSDDSFETISSIVLGSKSERSRIDVVIKQNDSQGNFDENQNTEERLHARDIEVSSKKQHKMLGFKANWSKNGSNIDEKNRKDAKQGEERKAKKTVSEKAANFMQNALKRISSDSKTNAKNSSHPESQLKRRSQNIASRSENRKSFIPVPTLS